LKTRLNKHPICLPFLSVASLSFILGTILANNIKVSFLVWYAVSALILFLAIYLRRRSGANLLILVFLLIGVLRQACFSTLNTDDVYYLSRFKLNNVALKGVVISQVQESPFNKSFLFLSRNIKSGNFSGNVSGKVHVRFNKRISFNYGDELVIEGRLSDLKDSGYFNKALLRQNVKSVLTVGKKDWITKLAPGHFSFKKTAFYIKDVLKKRFNNIPSPTREFLIAFILGDREGLSKEIYSVFRYTGTVHIIAISGLHIVIIVFIFVLLLKIFRLKIKTRFVITVLFLIFYSLMTGLRPSVVRAVIMGIIFLLSFIIKREYYIYNSLALSAMIIVGIWPWQLFDLGFQLSYISVFSIVYLTPKISSVLPKSRNRPLSFAISSLVVSLAASLGTMPLVAYCFGMISPVSLIANLFIVPLTPFILAGGFLYLLASFVAPFFLKWISLSLEFMIYTLIYLANLFKSIPFSYFYVDKFPACLLFLYYAVMLIFFNKHVFLILSKRLRKNPS
jgi:competence protein ComEC